MSFSLRRKPWTFDVAFTVPSKNRMVSAVRSNPGDRWLRLFQGTEQYWNESTEWNEWTSNCLSSIFSSIGWFQVGEISVQSRNAYPGTPTKYKLIGYFDCRPIKKRTISPAVRIFIVYGYFVNLCMVQQFSFQWQLKFWKPSDAETLKCET